jgi:hypothetical protein
MVAASLPRFRIVLIAAVALYGAAIAGACSASDPVAIPIVDELEAGAAAATDPALIDPLVEAGAASRPPRIPGAGDGTEANVVDAGHPVDASGCAPADCDCDDDGFNALTKPGCADAGGKNDCNDGDQRYRPDEGFLDVLPPDGGGDWNCNGTVEPYYDAFVSCGGLSLGGCSGEGFEDNPRCGDVGTYVKCVPGLVTCGTQVLAPRKQRCR